MNFFLVGAKVKNIFKAASDWNNYFLLCTGHSVFLFFSCSLREHPTQLSHGDTGFVKKTYILCPRYPITTIAIVIIAISCHIPDLLINSTLSCRLVLLIDTHWKKQGTVVSGVLLKYP